MRPIEDAFRLKMDNPAEYRKMQLWGAASVLIIFIIIIIGLVILL